MSPKYRIILPRHLFLSDEFERRVVSFLVVLRRRRPDASRYRDANGLAEPARHLRLASRLNPIATPHPVSGELDYCSHAAISTSATKHAAM